MANTLTLTVKQYTTRTVAVPATKENPASTKIVADIQANSSAGNTTVNINLNGQDPTNYPESTYGAGKIFSITL